MELGMAHIVSSKAILYCLTVRNGGRVFCYSVTHFFYAQAVFAWSAI